MFTGLTRGKTPATSRRSTSVKIWTRGRTPDLSRRSVARTIYRKSFVGGWLPVLSRIVLEPVVAVRTICETRTFQLDVTTMFSLLRTPSFAAPGNYCQSLCRRTSSAEVVTDIVTNLELSVLLRSTHRSWSTRRACPSSFEVHTDIVRRRACVQSFLL